MQEQEKITLNTVREEIIRKIYHTIDNATDIEKLAKTLNIICNLCTEDKPAGQPDVYKRIRQELEKKAQEAASMNEKM